MKSIVLYIIIFYAALTVAVYFLANSQAFHPPVASYQDNEEIIKLTTENGARISAVYLPNESAKYTILVSHGNAEDLGDIDPFLQRLQEEGFAVFAYDYEGYGTSEGKSSEQKVYQNIKAAYDYMTKELGLSPKHIVLYGRSLGAAASIDLASKEPVGGLIIQSGFTSALRTVTQYPLFMFDRFNNLKKIKQVTAPVLVIHGKKDSIVPFHHSETLYEAANCPKDFLWIDDAGHNDIGGKGGDIYWQKLQNISSMADLISKVQRQLKVWNREKEQLSS